MQNQDGVQCYTDLWQQASRRGLPWFRFLRRSLDPSSVAEQLQSPKLKAEWQQLCSQLQPGDKIWPFEFHVRSYLGMRRGYIIMRQGQPIGGIITAMS